MGTTSLVPAKVMILYLRVAAGFMSADNEVGGKPQPYARQNGYLMAQPPCAPDKETDNICLKSVRSGSSCSCQRQVCELPVASPLLWHRHFYFNRYVSGGYGESQGHTPASGGAKTPRNHLLSQPRKVPDPLKIGA